jgi:hypothetical protein
MSIDKKENPPRIPFPTVRDVEEIGKEALSGVVARNEESRRRMDEDLKRRCREIFDEF